MRDPADKPGAPAPCDHDVILNGVCFYCGSADIDPVAISPKKPPAVIAPDRLVRKKR